MFQVMDAIFRNKMPHIANKFRFQHKKSKYANCIPKKCKRHGNKKKEEEKVKIHV